VDGRVNRLAEALRDIARGGLAAAVAGVVVIGIGGRLAMTIAARLNPSAEGAFTEAGNVVGRFTVDGTAAFLLFNGLGTGLTAGVVWVIVSPWLPVGGARRAGAAFVSCALIGSGFVIESTNRDFQLLDPAPLLIALFVGVVGMLGVATAWLDARLDRRLPRGSVIPYGVVALLGAPALILTVNAFFSSEFRTAAAPVVVGAALVVCGLATVARWLTRTSASPVAWGPVGMLGRAGVIAAAIAGAARLWEDVARIVA
jgi:hypothetical protein